ncbi:acetolactate decarboxylase [Fructobacillus parabroussonetiae]|uniref:Alpha-acetolactate decarboxylase n=1 Tax=Fructobacillus parabroussonetiae TaxID=2713174 RepID=A0ABS5QVY9_9LACO|nr:acetolactate decarboxylase [Fructobacillus parabroussonetiae]MBS9337286.1 acetolactate decarboxylase [Fructobacillus parabroussonetiae]
MSSITQFGTMQMLVESLLDGFVTAKDMLKAGNTGIGTGAGVDGELILLDGKAYQVNGKGQVQEVADDFPVVFGDVHQAAYQVLGQYENQSFEDLSSDILQAVGSQNLFLSVKITGDFQHVQTRSAQKSEKPYPGLGEIAKKQMIFNQDNVSGTMVGYYTPSLYEGVGVPGFHMHFLSDQKDFGGHVLDSQLKNVEVSIQILDALNVKLPVNNRDYKKADLSHLDHLSQVIHAAES